MGNRHPESADMIFTEKPTPGMTLCAFETRDRLLCMEEIPTPLMESGGMCRLMDMDGPGGTGYLGHRESGQRPNEHRPYRVYKRHGFFEHPMLIAEGHKVPYFVELDPEKVIWE